MLGIKPKSLVCLFIGKLESYKGCITFVETMILALKKGLDVHGIIIGEGSKKYEIMRPLDLTIPITYHLDNFSIKKEVQLIKSQIDNRNFSGVNKMFYNIIKFQKITIYLKKDIIFLIFLNQICLIKMKLKKFIFRYFQLNN